MYLGAGGWLSVAPSEEWGQAVEHSLSQVSQTYPGYMY